MGLGRSKAHPRAIKVAPLKHQEAESPSAGPVLFALTRNLEEKSTYSFTRLQDQNQTLERQLPLCEKPGMEDILQKLEPIGLPQIITSERLLSQQEVRTKHKAKQEPGKIMQIPMFTSGKRQYLHKMQMLEMNRKRQEAQMELRKSLLQKARINVQKLKDQRDNSTLQSMPRSVDCDILTMLPDQTANRGPGYSQDEDFLNYHVENDDCPRKIGKMETWLREQEAQGQRLRDSSSSDSDDPEKEKRPQALVRTRTERIPLYDEFFDSE